MFKSMRFSGSNLCNHSDILRMFQDLEYCLVNRDFQILEEQAQECSGQTEAKPQAEGYFVLVVGETGREMCPNIQVQGWHL